MAGGYTSTTYVGFTGDDRIDGVLTGYAWSGTITYAFPTSALSYEYEGEPQHKFAAISQAQQNMALFFLDQSYGNTANDGFSVEGFTNATFEQAADPTTASIRFAQSSDPDTAWTYYPGSDPWSGDVWFGTAYAGTASDYRKPEFGNYAGQTLMHELGHALGLKHGHEADDGNTTIVPDAYDSIEYTTMTYHSYVGDDANGYTYEQNGAPQTFMMLDIAALQQMYGANYTTNSGDTVYKWDPSSGITYVNGVAAITPAANRIFATIWDGGGSDTYDLSAYKTNLRIDLRAGGYSFFSQGQLAYLGGGPNGGYARGNIFNALLFQGNTASLIENAIAGSGNDTLVGNELGNTLTGGAGNDTLDGGTGADTLIGGLGNDTYIVDDDGDAVVEDLNAGTDTIKTALASYSLAAIANVENLTYTGTDTTSFTGTGNALINVITGGKGNDTLDGGAGADTMIGGLGNDIYYVDNAADIVTEAVNAGTDTVNTSLSALTLAANVEDLVYTGTNNFAGTGNTLANTITGGSGNDTLNGGAGIDTMIGGLGDDTYIVDNAADIVTENAGEGTDTIKTTLTSYSLATTARAAIENLTYTGTAAFTGTGNGLANTITGGAGADILDGGTGTDTLIGGLGNDTYIVSDASDIVTEAANAGTDLIKTTLASYSLAAIANVENLTYTGTSDFTGTGNGLANVITGAAGNDTLDGGAGADTMIGGLGNDTYYVDNAADVVTEAANAGTDEIRTSLTTYSLATRTAVENLTYTGTGNFAGTGNALVNIITGGSGNDTLDGGTGADTLIGGAGDDTYVVDAGDTVTETANAGTDTIRTALASYTLGANIENLTYTGKVAFTGTGNSLGNVIAGGAAADKLTGGSGNDTLNGGAGIDTMIGGLGDDTYIVDNAADIVTENAGEGTDTIKTTLTSYSLATTARAAIENLTYTGTAAFTGTGNSLANTITGGSGADILDGGTGTDTLIGGLGNDTYIVSDASDIVTEAANAGTDLIKTALASYSLAAIANVENLTYTGTDTTSFTGTGNALINIITGGKGDDTLDGGAGADTLIGGLGNDIYYVDNAADIVTEAANAGTDTVNTGLSALTLAANVENLVYTGSGNFAGTGNTLANTITGGDGNDTLNGGAGIDTMIGGLGDDTYIVDNAADIVTENAGEGTDTIKTTLTSYSLATTARAAIENLTYTGTAAFTGTGNSLANTITGGSGADILDGGTGTDTLVGGLGNDTYIVSDASDIVTEAANAGTDLIKTTLASYSLAAIANVENLTYTGTSDFTGTGNGLANVITGGKGNDTLDGGAGAGADTLIGGLGNDIYYVDNAADVVTEAANAGTDEIRTSLTTYSLATRTAVENLTYTGTGSFIGTGNALVNVITGGSGNDTLDGGTGADTLIGGAGDDTYIVDAGDTVTEAANAGTDTIRTALASYTLGANIENLTYTGTVAFTGTGNDLGNVITGGAAADKLTGGSGNDTLNGGAGIDTMIGGLGDDTYIVDNAADVVTENAGEGTDTIKTTLTSYSLATTARAAIENLTYTGTAAFTGTGNSLANTITGGSGADILDGGTGTDTLIGGLGNDTYIVSDANDIITEAANAGTDLIKTALASYSLAAIANVENLTYTGTDTTSFIGTGNALINVITGGKGNDTLDGGAGADMMIGGLGNDIYYVDNAADIVTEAVNAGTDTVNTSLSALTLAANVEDLVYTGTNNFAGTGNTLANTITGGSGNDTLNGGAGIDTMIGGLGDDTYIVDNAADIVTENAGEGTDTIKTTLTSYSLATTARAAIENLTYTGTAAFTGTGNSLANTITGGSGADILDGGTGTDTLVGGLGNDTYIVSDASDIVTEAANAGTDLIKTTLASYSLAAIANVENLTYTGTSDFTGTGNGLANVITGAAGNDTLDGGAGADTMIGGLGNDTYYVDNAADVVTEAANAGTDEIRTSLTTYSLATRTAVENLTYTGTGNFAGTGNALVNIITGGSGNDTLDGGTGADTLIGGAGDDTYVVDAGDTVTETANAGTDTIRTALASYTLGANIENLTYTGKVAFTGTGNSLGNVIAGGAAADKLTGGSGNDTLNGGAGIDTMIGGLGDDTYIVDNAADIVTENAGEGTDTIKTTLTSYSLATTARAAIENLTYTGTAAFTGTGNSLANTITGGSGADILDGGTGTDTLIGGLGNDTYIVSDANDIITEAANAGTDLIKTALASYSLAAIANVENLTYTGTDTTSFIGTGNALINVITGGKGNDTLDGGAGADMMIGGLGNDIYYVDNAADIVTEAVNAGTDTVNTSLSALTLAANVEDLVYTGTNNFAGTGNTLANTITGGSGNDTLNGGAGIDTMIGGLGDDTYIVDNAADIVTENAGEGTDTIKTTLTSYSLASKPAVENLTYTGTAAFTGTGNSLANTITGGAGADILDGGTGTDTLIGGLGNDTYIVSDASDIVTEAANAGTDLIKTTLASYSLAAIANVENLTYTGTGDFTGTGNGLANVITGAAGNDVLDGGAGADTMIGGLGNDIYYVDNSADIVTEAANAGTDEIRTSLTTYSLATRTAVENLTYTGTGNFTGTGNALVNVITGGSGNDTLDGGTGADTLIGGAGDDILTGGADADFFVYMANWGHDTITDFTVAGTTHDTIKIDHTVFADWAALLAASTQSGSDTLITADANNTIKLQNVLATNLQSTDFQFA